MAGGVMIRCSGARDGLRCYRRIRILTPKGAVKDPNPTYTCTTCQQGQPPYVPRSSERKGQQKQASKKKK